MESRATFEEHGTYVRCRFEGPFEFRALLELTGEVRAYCVEQDWLLGGAPGAAARSAGSTGREVARVDRLAEELLRVVLPELRHGRDGQDDRVL